MIAEWIANQFRRPTGFWGRVVASLMAKGNLAANMQILELLQIEDSDTVLEIGFGPGLGLYNLLCQNARCKATGIDFSPLMVTKASKTNRNHIQQNRLKLILGDFLTHDFPSLSFSKIFGVNVIYFWSDLSDVSRKLHTLLKPSGTVILFMVNKNDIQKLGFTKTTIFNKHDVDDVVATFRKAGFGSVEPVEIQKNNSRAYCIKATK